MRCCLVFKKKKLIWNLRVLLGGIDCFVGEYKLCDINFD